MESRLDKIKNKIFELNKDQLLNLIISSCASNETVLNIINKHLKPQPHIIPTNNRINFDIQKHMAFKFMYVGKNYDGLVTQKDTKNTVEEHIFNALKKAALIQDEESCNWSRCGRTDAGVSSVGNVFDLTLRYKPGIDYIKILNNILPNDIRIIGSAEVSDDFDSRFSCLFREYKYFFIANELDVDAMRRGCSKLVGLHNFRNFCKIDKSQPVDKNYMRRIYEFEIEKYKDINEFNVYYAIIKGSAFLWHQVRCMMAILFLIGKGSEEDIIIDNMLNVDLPYIYNYEIASDQPLVLTNCQFEGVEFNITQENGADNFFKIKEITEKVILDSSIHSFMLDNYNNQTLRDNISDLQKFKKKSKYTKLLNHKTNRK